VGYKKDPCGTSRKISDLKKASQALVEAEILHDALDGGRSEQEHYPRNDDEREERPYLLDGVITGGHLFTFVFALLNGKSIYLYIWIQEPEKGMGSIVKDGTKT
jgi:hypothetical protein